MLQRAAKILLSLPDLVSVLTRDGKFDEMNQSWFENLDWKEVDLKAKAFEEFLHPEEKLRFNFLIKNAESEPSTHLLKVRLRHRSGAYRWYSLTMIFVPAVLKASTEVEGAMVEVTAAYFSIIARDITEQIFSDERLNLVLEAANLGAWDWNLETDEVVFGRGWCELLGIDPQKAPQDLSTWHERIHPDDKEKTYSDIQAHIRGETQFYENTHRLKHGSGGWIWVVGRGRVTARSIQGFPLRFSGTIADITKERTVEEATKAVRDRMELALNAAKMGVWDMDLITNRLSWDERMFALYGVTPESFEVSLSNWGRMIVPEDLDRAREVASRALRGEGDYRVELRLIHPSGDIRVIQAVASIQRDERGSPVRMIGINRDVTEKRLSEEKIRTNEHFLGSILDSIPDPVFIKNRGHRWIRFNEAFCQFLGKSKEELLGKTDEDIFPAEQAENFWEKDEEVFQSHTDNINEELLTSSDGAVHNISTKKRALEIPGYGEVLVGVIRDITHLKKIERDIRDSQEKLKALFETSSLGMVLTEVDGRIVDANPAFKRLVGIEIFDDLSKISLKDLTPNKYFEEDALQQQVLEFVGHYDSYEKEFRMLNSEATIPVMLKGQIVSDGSGTKRIWTIIEDLRPKKAHEEDLQKERLRSMGASKMAALGEMAGGVAHEINNPLNVIMGRASLLSSLIQGATEVPKEKLIEGLKKIETTAERIARIVSGLRTFSRNSDADPFVPVKIKSLLQNTLELCVDRLKMNDIELQISDPGELAVECREAQIGQVILTLLNNGCDAVKTLQERWIKVQVLEQEDTVSISVTDSGKGIPKEVVDKMFQPFFTTKEVGKGTGLGLSISKGIIEDHAGKFWLDQNAHNTSFVIVLPKIQKENPIPSLKAG